MGERGPATHLPALDTSRNERELEDGVGRNGKLSPALATSPTLAAQSPTLARSPALPRSPVLALSPTRALGSPRLEGEKAEDQGDDALEEEEEEEEEKGGQEQQEEQEQIKSKGQQDGDGVEAAPAKLESQELFDSSGKWRARTPRDAAELKAMLKEVEQKQAKLPARPRPKPVECRPEMRAHVRLQRIQRYISSFEYNHTTTNYFSIRKDRGPKRLATTAREIMRECLPIKCIEAVFLGFYLTLGMKDLTRIPIRFQTSTQDNKYHYKHIVMAVGHRGKWGALGLSRKSSLMFKELTFSSLADLLEDFHDSYQAIGHKLEHVGVGLPFGHNEYSVESIHWRPLMIHFENSSGWSPEIAQAINIFASKMDSIAPHVIAHGRLPEWYLAQFPCVKRGSTETEEDGDNERFSDGGGPEAPVRVHATRKAPVPRQPRTSSRGPRKQNVKGSPSAADASKGKNKLEGVKVDEAKQEAKEAAKTVVENKAEDAKEVEAEDWDISKNDAFSSLRLDVPVARSGEVRSAKSAPLNPTNESFSQKSVEPKDDDTDPVLAETFKWLRVDEAAPRAGEERSDKMAPLNPRPSITELRSPLAEPYNLCFSPSRHPLPFDDEARSNIGLNSATPVLTTIDGVKWQIPQLISTPRPQAVASADDGEPHRRQHRPLAPLQAEHD